jgi:hypothetical protein
MERLTIREMEILVSYNPETGEFHWRKPRPNATSGSRAGGMTAYGYRKISVCGRNYLEHRLAWLFMTGEYPDGEIDHINGDKIDNRYSNLRLATPSQNQANKGMRSDNTSGVKGVTWDKSRGKWLASIHKDGERIPLGRYNDINDAAEAYRAASIEYFAEFSRPERRA